MDAATERGQIDPRKEKNFVKKKQTDKHLHKEPHGTVYFKKKTKSSRTRNWFPHPSIKTKPKS